MTEKHRISNSNNKGSLTVEAALVLPLFLCVILTITTFINIYITHETIQFAIDETAETMAEMHYVLHVAGFLGTGSMSDGIGETGVLPSILDNVVEKIKDATTKSGLKMLLVSNISARMHEHDPTLGSLFIVGGVDGLDVSKSDLTPDDEFIDVVVSYRIKIPLPIQFLGEVPIIQRAKVRVWRDGGAIKVPKNGLDD